MRFRKILFIDSFQSIYPPELQLKGDSIQKHVDLRLNHVLSQKESLTEFFNYLHFERIIQVYKTLIHAFSTVVFASINVFLEFSSENLICVIEMIQFREYCLNKFPDVGEQIPPPVSHITINNNFIPQSDLIGDGSVTLYDKKK